MKSILGRQAVLEQCPEILTDESRFSYGIPDEVWFPETNEDLHEVMRRAAKEKIPVTLSGARTGITAGAVPPEGGMVISFSHMNRIIRCEMSFEGTPILFCQPGITLTTIAEFLENPQNWKYAVAGSELLPAGKYFYPPDPTEMTAQLGGTVANNASGARSYYFGPTRSHVQSLDIILATGDKIGIERGEMISDKWNVTLGDTTISVPLPNFPRAQVKNATGFYSGSQLNPTDLFIGSEGILGAFSLIGIRLLEKPQFLSGLSFFPSRSTAFDFADFLRNEQHIAAVEYFDVSVLGLFRSENKPSSVDIPPIPEDLHCAVYWEYIESQDSPFETVFDTWETKLNECGSSFENTWSGFEAAESKKLKMFRHAVPEMVNTTVAANKKTCSSVRKIGTDSALPSSQFRSWFDSCVSRIEEAGIQYAAFGHLGDYHIHINMLPRSEEQLQNSLSLYHDFMVDACKRGGTISAEHGIGKLKSGLLECMFSKEALEQMWAVKRALDPYNLVNRETLLKTDANE